MQNRWQPLTLDKNPVFGRKLSEEVFIEQSGRQIRGMPDDWILTTRDGGVFVIMTEAQLSELVDIPPP